MQRARAGTHDSCLCEYPCACGCLCHVDVTVLTMLIVLTLLALLALGVYWRTLCLLAMAVADICDAIVVCSSGGKYGRS